MNNRKRPRSNSVDNRMARNLDILADYDSFLEEVAPILRAAIAKGTSPEDMRKHPKIRALMEARKITIALTDKDPGRALAAIKDTDDRVEGKALERTENINKYQGLKPEELDSMLLSAASDISAIADDVAADEADDIH